MWFFNIIASRSAISSISLITVISASERKQYVKCQMGIKSFLFFVCSCFSRLHRVVNFFGSTKLMVSPALITLTQFIHWLLCFSWKLQLNLPTFAVLLLIINNHYFTPFIRLCFALLLVIHNCLILYLLLISTYILAYILADIFSLKEVLIQSSTQILKVFSSLNQLHRIFYTIHMQCLQSE